MKQSDTARLTCACCGRTFAPGNDPSTGVPNGVGLGLHDGTTVTVCAECLCEVGRTRRLPPALERIVESDAERKNGKQEEAK